MRTPAKPSRLDTLTNNLGGSATTHDLAQTFTYNPAGQIQSVARSNDAYAWQANVDRAYVADGLNMIMNAGGAAFGYDARGNLTSAAGATFAYDSQNRLTDGPGGAKLKYDALGRPFTVHTTANPTPTVFAYDGIDRIADYRASGSTVSIDARYVHGGIDNPIVWYDGSTISNATRRFLMTDERGSVVSVTDSAGATIHINAYDEYGIPAPGNVGKFGYTGQVWVPEVGMWYYKARMYSPTLGRFMQTDPIGYSDGMNWYNYVGSDPVNFVDPLGLARDVTGPDGNVWRYVCVGDDDGVVCGFVAMGNDGGTWRDQPEPGTRPGESGPGEGGAGPQKEKSLGDRAKDAWCVASALDLDILPGIMSAGDVDDFLAATALIGSQASILKSDVTGRRGTMRNAGGNLNPSGRFTSPLSVAARSLFGRSAGRAIARGGSRILPIAAVGLKAKSMYEGLDDAEQCGKE